MGVACVPVDAPPAVGDPAPDVQAATLDGDPMALSDLRGQVVLVNLWATWCAPCRFETPFLQSLYEDYRERGFEIVGISVDDAGFEDVVREFTGEHGVTYTILHDPAMGAMDAFHAVGLPATYLIGRDGTIRFVRIGPVSEEDRAFFDALEVALG
jgi:peroxiredoxin